MPSIEELNEKYAGAWILVKKPGEAVRLSKVRAVKDRFICTFLVDTERTWRLLEEGSKMEFSAEIDAVETVSFDDLESGEARIISLEEALDVLRGVREKIAHIL